MTDCIFCRHEKLEIVAENDLALAFYDGCPVNPGHLLVIPRRHAESFFDTTSAEHAAITELVFEVKTYLDEKYSPDGYNIGANIGRLAGQSVFHYHLHVIPRYSGDIADPRGGVRRVLKHRKKNC